MKITNRLRVIAATLVSFVAIVGSAAATHAAPPYETTATITSIDFVSETVRGGSEAELTGAWSLPDNPTSPAGFAVDLPEELQGLTDSFALLDPQGVAMGECEVNAAQIVCDFDEAYLAENPRNLSGTFNFWASIRTVVTEESAQTYVIDGKTVTIVVTPPSGDCVGECVFTGRNSNKSGSYDRNTDTILWIVRVASGADGAIGGEAMSVEDNLGPNQELLTEFAGVTYPLLRQTTELVTTSNGYQQPGNWVETPTDQYEVDGGTVSWTAEAGHYYSIRYMSKVTDGGAAGAYTNSATVTVGEDGRTVSSQVVRQGGGGTGVGDNVGRFSITKDVVWEDTPVEGLDFTGTFTVTTPDNTVSEGHFVVEDGATWTSAEFPRGSVVHIEEILPTDPSNISWQAPALSTNDFALVGGTTTEVTLTNTANLAKGVFSAKKSLEGDGAGEVPADAVFLLDYAYEAGAGFAAGSGTLELPADGTTVSSPELPVGAVVTLSERTPEAVPGATWGAPVLSVDTLTIGGDDAEAVIVTVTNTLTLEPPTPTPPTPPLATTGGSGWEGLLMIGGLLVAAGVIAVRRARSTMTH